MKKLITTFALLAAALACSAEKEFDETKGLTLSSDELGKLEEELKAGKQAKADLESAKAELQKKNDELKAAQAKAEQDKTAIDTLTAERDNFKAKYEKQPADTPDTNGKDSTEKNEDTFAEYVANDPYYQEIENTLGL